MRGALKASVKEAGHYRHTARTRYAVRYFLRVKTRSGSWLVKSKARGGYRLKQSRERMGTAGRRKGEWGKGGSLEALIGREQEPRGEPAMP